MSAGHPSGAWIRAAAPAAAALVAALGCVSLGIDFARGVDVPVLTVEGFSPGEDEEAPPFEATVALDVDAGVLADGSYVITSVRATSVDVWIDGSSAFDSGEDGVADDFAFLDSAQVYLEAEVGGEIVRTLVARVGAGDGELQPGSDYVALEATGAELVALMSAPGGCVFTVDLTGAVPPDDVAIAGTIVFHVSATTR
jgi:hypothetical protein